MDTEDMIDSAALTPEGGWPWQARTRGMAAATWVERDGFLAALRACSTRDAEQICRAGNLSPQDAEALLAEWVAAADAAVDDRHVPLVLLTRNLWPGAADRAATCFGLVSQAVSRLYLRGKGNDWATEAYGVRRALSDAWDEPVLLAFWLRSDGEARSESDVCGNP